MSMMHSYLGIARNFDMKKHHVWQENQKIVNTLVELAFELSS